MQQALGRFVQALRAEGIPVSAPETLDALQAMQLLGVESPATLKQALALVLVKNQAQQLQYESLFEQFFTSSTLSQSAAATNSHSASKADTDNGSDQQATAEQNQHQNQEQDQNQDSNLDFAAAEQLQSQLANDLLADDQNAFQVAIAAASDAAGGMNMTVFTQQGVVSQRIMRELGDDELRDDMLSLSRQAEDDVDAATLLQELRDRRRNLRSRVAEHVERQFLLHGAAQGRRLRDENLEKVDLGNVDYSQQEQLEKLIRKAAKRLASLHGRRRRITHRGLLDVRKTIAANAAFDGVLFHTKWKASRIERPKVMVLCDISGSMARYSHFLLLFLVSLQDVLPRVRSFVFTSDLFEVTEDLTNRDTDKALKLIRKNMANGSTDYGVALRDFRDTALADVDSRTTVIMMGDARNNQAPSEAAIWQQVYRRSQRVLWLNPEGKGRWDSGDSVMSEYLPYCSTAENCKSVRDLSRVLSSLLKMAR